MLSRAPTRLIAALPFLTLIVAGACSGSDEELPTIRAAGFSFSESHVLSWIFAIAFEDAGYDVDTSQIQPGSTREILTPELQEGRLDFLPEYTGSLLSHLGGQPTSDSETTYAAARDLYAEDGVALLSYAPAQNQNAFVVTTAFAEERDVSSLSDLAPIADELAFAAPPECPVRYLCAIGLEEVYGIEFDEFMPLDERARVGALEGGAVHVVLLFTTDAPLAGPLAAGEWLVLEDDRDLVPAENIALAVRQEIIDVYGDALVEIVDAISERLTTEELSELNRRVQIDGIESKVAARAWLESEGLIAE